MSYINCQARFFNQHEQEVLRVLTKEIWTDDNALSADDDKHVIWSKAPKQNNLLGNSQLSVSALNIIYLPNGRKGGRETKKANSKWNLNVKKHILNSLIELLVAHIGT